MYAQPILFVYIRKLYRFSVFLHTANYNLS
nr:MAG TPA: hypothetical protein [Caudoviricetes sp.]